MGQVLSQLKQDLWPVPVLHEMIRIFPDAIFWGVGVIALATLSYSYGIFFCSLVEGVGIYYLIKSINNSIGIVETSPSESSAERSCNYSFAGISLQSVSIFGEPGQIPFPSSHIFMLSFISSYILSVINMFKDELDILGATYGESYTSRLYFSIIAFSVILFISMAYRLFYKCDSFMVITLSLFVGVASGIIVVQQNNLLLGLEGINLLGVPILRKRTADGNDLYVCSSVS